MKSQAPLSRRALLAAGLGSAALLAGCGERARILALGGTGLASFQGLSMGSSYTVKIAGRSVADSTLAAAQAVVDAALADVVARMSHYDASSELSRLNRQPVGEPFALSAPTQQVLTVAQAVRQASGGAFDISVGRAVDSWGFGPARRARAMPGDSELAELRRQPLRGALDLDARAGTVTRQAAVQADLSGIAKGYGVDRAAAALDALGLADYMVEVGGEVRARGRNGEGRPWQLAIEMPDAMPQQAWTVLPLDGRALATSGDYRNFFVHDGRRYCHEIDPETAAPVRHALASVSVVAADCTLADAWSTALFVLGPERGLQTAAAQGLAAHFIVRQPGGGFVEQQTPAFAALGSRRIAA